MILYLKSLLVFLPVWFSPDWVVNASFLFFLFFNRSFLTSFVLPVSRSCHLIRLVIPLRRFIRPLERSNPVRTAGSFDSHELSIHPLGFYISTFSSFSPSAIFLRPAGFLVIFFRLKPPSAFYEIFRNICEILKQRRGIALKGHRSIELNLSNFIRRSPQKHLNRVYYTNDRPSVVLPRKGLIACCRMRARRCKKKKDGSTFWEKYWEKVNCKFAAMVYLIINFLQRV